MTMPERCQECRTLDGSCRQFVIGHPHPVCTAGYANRRRGRDDVDDLDSEDAMALDLLIPVPRRSPENVRIR